MLLNLQIQKYYIETLLSFHVIKGSHKRLVEKKYKERKDIPLSKLIHVCQNFPYTICYFKLSLLTRVESAEFKFEMLKGEERRNGHVLFLLLCIFKDNSLFRLYGSAKNYEREHDTKKLFATKEMLRRDERRIHLHTRRFIALAVGSVMLITLCVLVDEFKLSLKSGFANRKFYERLQLSSVQVKTLVWCLSTSNLFFC